METTPRHYSPIVVWPFVLIGAGIVALLVNAGAITWDGLGQIAGLWPFVLVLVGIELIISRTVRPAIALPANIAISLAALAGTLALVVSGASWSIGSWWPTSPVQTISRSAPIDGISQATVTINYGAADLKVQAGSIGTELYRASATYAGSPAPSIWLDRTTGTLHIDRGNRNPVQVLPAGRHEQVDLVLSNAIPWAVNVNAGASQQTLDLRDLTLSSVRINGGATSVEIDLPAASGLVPVRIDGGALTARLNIRQGTALRVTSSGGFNSLQIDGQAVGGFGQQTWQTPDFAGATNRYDIQFSGGASTVRVERQ